MEWHSLFVISALLSGLFLILLAYQGWMRRHITGTPAFVALLLTAAYWCLIYAGELASVDFQVIIFLNRLKYIGIAFLPVTWVMFAAQYTGKQHLISRYRFGLLLLIPIVTQVMVWTNYNNMFLASIRFYRPAEFAVLAPSYGAWFWVHAFYSYGLLLLGLLLLLQHSWNNRHLGGLNPTLIIIAASVPLIANLVFVLNPNLSAGFDITPVAILLSSLLLGWGLLKLRLLDVVPIAYDTVMMHLPDGVLVLDTRHRIRLVNPIARQYLGLPDGHLVGVPLKETIPDVSPELVQLLGRTEAIVNLLLGTRYIEARLSTLYGEREKHKGQVLVLRDVTARHKAETDLGEQLQQMATLANLDDTLVGTLDIDELVTVSLNAAIHLSKANAGFIALRDGDRLRIHQCIGAYPRDIQGVVLPPGDGIVGRVLLNQEPELVADVRQDDDYREDIPQTVSQITIPLHSRDQLVGVLNLETSDAALFDENRYVIILILANRIAAALETARLYGQMQTQLTQTQALNDKLQKLEQIKTDMIRIASHDLKNPLAVIQGFLEVLKVDRADFTPKHAEYLDVMEKSANRMNAILEDILSMERIESMAEDAIHQPVNLNQIVNDGAREYHEQVTEKSQTLAVICPDDELYVLGDAAQLREAVTNLIGNAVKYTPDKGSVTVLLEQRAQDAYFEVFDTGYGIPDDLQAELFQPFYRARTDANAHIEGTGLGLHLVKNIIQRHQGTIGFESEVGAGSRFFFSLPLKQSQQVAQSAADES